MPLGWYLAQGLVPLGYSSSDDDEGPCELPNGRIVCGPHGLEICHKCCVDFTLGNDMLSSDSEEDDDYEDELSGPDLVQVSAPITGSRVDPPAPVTNIRDIDGLRRGTGRVFPTRFVPPSDSANLSPSELFCGRRDHILVTRYTLPTDGSTGLICTDGACLDNGQSYPKAGWAFWHGSSATTGRELVASGRLEKKGPFGDDVPQTSNRAELRAIIAALRFRYWPGEGFRTLVIATDSAYVVDGATHYARTWVRNGWVTTRGTPVQNKDLWEALMGEIEKYSDDGGMEVKFWRVPREWNTVADAAAKRAATEQDAPDQFGDVIGMNI